MRHLLLCSLAVVLFAVTLLGADASGTWTGQMPTMNGDTEVTFKLKQAGNGLTGSMNAFDNEIAIQNGKVDGDKVSFTVTVEFNGGFKILFNGAIKDNLMQLTREREGSGNKQNFTVKRVS